MSAPHTVVVTNAKTDTPMQAGEIQQQLIDIHSKLDMLRTLAISQPGDFEVSGDTWRGIFLTISDCMDQLNAIEVEQPEVE